MGGVDLKVAPGEIYGFLGPNGAGKTTTIRMLATLLPPDSGSARVFGHDIVREADEVRGRVSLTGQFASVDEDLTGLENLVLIARLLGLSRVQARARERAARGLRPDRGGRAAGQEVLGRHAAQARHRSLHSRHAGSDLPGRADGGAGSPEPQPGMGDRPGLAAGGTTVLLTTQYLDEADQLADRIAVIDHGRVIAEGTPSELKASVGSGTLHVRLRDLEDRPEAERVLSQALGVPVHLESDPAALSARVSEAERVAHALGELSRSGVALGLSLGQPSLDEVFLALTGRPAENDNEEDAA